MRRKDRELSPEQALEVVDSALWTVLSVLDPEGLPYGVPLNVIRKEAFIYFHSAKEGFKLNALAKNPHVCLSFVASATLKPQDLTTLYQSAIVRGIAQEVDDLAEKRMALTLLGEKFAPSQVHLLEGEINKFLPHTSIWKVEVESITGKENK